MASKRILIVDDEQRTLLFLRESLAVAGLEAELVCASTPEAALEAFQLKPFDLLVTDICLVGMDGVELLSRLREIKPRLPAILVSGQSSTTTEAHIRQLESARYFRKPFAFEEFVLAVANALQEPLSNSGHPLPPAGPNWQSWQLESAQRRLANLLQDSGAQSVCLAEAQGNIITQVGNQLPSLEQWTSPPDIDDSTFNFSYHQGRTHDIYSAKVGEGIYLVITFGRDQPSTRIGRILQYSRRTAQEVARILYTQADATVT